MNLPLGLRLPGSPVEDSIEGRAFVFSAFAVAVLAIVVYGQDYVVPVIGLATAAVGHVVSYRERAMRRSFWRQVFLVLFILVALAYFVSDSVLALFGGILPQANFAILLVAVSSFDLKSRRNCFSSLWISLAILYLAAVYAWDYVFAAFVAMWVLCLAGFWMSTHLRRMKVGMGGPPRAIAGSAAAALVLGAGLFVALPQPNGSPTTPLAFSVPSFTNFAGDMESPVLPLVQVTGAPAGASSGVDLHYRGRLGDSPVMYVRTSAPAYWRGLVFDTYKNGAWTASLHGFRDLQAYVSPQVLPPEPQDSLGTFVQVFRIIRPMPGVINAAYPIQSLYAPFSSLREDAYGTFHTPEAFRPGQTYSVVSYIPDLSADALKATPAAPAAPLENSVYLDAGQLSQQAKDLAASVTAGTTTEYDTVLALTRFLQRSYHYSLQLSPVPSGKDAVDWFLFDVKTGYCEQFASAETLMLRSLGIPARLATGYSTGEYDPVLDQSVVRERDAHAWVEVWFQGHGWVPVDPTPGVAPIAAATFAGHWAAGGIARLIPHLAIGAPIGALGAAGVLAMLAPVLGIAALVVLAWLWLRRRRRVRRTPPAPGESELLRLYERLQRRTGRRRSPPETPLEYLGRVEAGDVGPLLADVTDAVNRGAYAGRWPEPGKVRELADRLS
ncbi:MAG TPA: transglutaminaseTgpA domain-containing protein [Patescibacteria group bacterium]|nr:transglutaminaseTgpA domain-containing protein [Patescibacteria group bacterium]